MKQTVYALLSCLMTFTAAAAQNPILPEDFFLRDFGHLRDTIRIEQLSTSSFEVRQDFGTWNREPAELDFMTFCVASAIAVKNHFNGWTMTMQPNDTPNAKSRRFTVVLLQDKKDAEGPPNTTNDWLPYQTAAGWHQTCNLFVNAKYMWPEGPPTIPESISPRSSPDVVSNAATDVRRTPWRASACAQSGAGSEKILTIKFIDSSLPKESASTTGRELKFTAKTLTAITENGQIEIPWRKMGEIATRAVADKDSNFFMHVTLPANVLPAGDFGVIDHTCQSQYMEFAGWLFSTMGF